MSPRASHVGFPVGKKRPVVWYMAAGYPLAGGIEAHILHYATEIRRQGFDVRVRVLKPLPRPPHRFLQTLRQRKIPVASLYEAAAPWAKALFPLLRTPWRAYRRLRHAPTSPEERLDLWLTRRWSHRVLAAWLQREQPDLIHIFGRLPAGIWDRLPAERCLYHEMMTGTVDRHWTPEELDEFRRFGERAARFFAPGEGVANNLHEAFGIRRPIVPIFTLCPDEAGTPPWHPAPARSPAQVRFGVICRLTSQKGIEYLLEAIREYRNRYTWIYFIFGGTGPLESSVRAFASRHQLSDVTVIPVRHAPPILHRMDLFVHPSVDDAMPMAIAEALMCGIPCVVSRVGGCPDLVRDGQEGWVISPRQPDQILEAMERFARLPTAVQTEFRRRARARYEAVCHPEQVIPQVLAQYDEVLRDLATPNRSTISLP